MYLIQYEAEKLAGDEFSDVTIVCTYPAEGKTIIRSINRARQLYKHISMLFLFPVKDGKRQCNI